MATARKRMPNLKIVLAAIDKKYGKGTIRTVSEMDHLKIKRVSTGSFSLDMELNGGFPCGRMIELFGPEGSGKSTMALKHIVERQKDKSSEIVFIDIEGAFDPKWARELGVDLSRLKISQPDTGEQAVDILCKLVKSGECDLVVLDSVALLANYFDLEKPMEDAEKMAGRAQLVNRGTRGIQSGLNKTKGKCTILFINQVREKVGISYGSKEYSPGGRGLRHGTSVKVNFRCGERFPPERDKQKIGQVVYFRITKNKTGAPYGTGQFDLYFRGKNRGRIDKLKEIITYALLSGIIRKSGNTYSWNGKKLGVGKNKVVKALREKPELVKKLIGEIRNVKKEENNKEVKSNGEKTSKKRGRKKKVRKR